MRLKRQQDIDYLDLPKLELPFFAKQWIESHLNVNDFRLCHVEGLSEVIQDPLDYHRHDWDRHAYSLLLQRIERAEVYLIHGDGIEPTIPLIWRGTGKNYDTWYIHDSLNHEQRFNAEWMLANAISKKGAWQPIQQPATEAPAPEPVTREEPDPLTVTNPRWEHVDSKRKEDSPEETTAGDIVTLMVDVTGVSDGARVTFKIVDTAISPPGRIAVVRGEVEGGVGKAEWEVKVRRDGTKPEFAGEVRRVSSEQAEIPVVVKPALRIGIFFDGTSNDLKKDDSLTNIAKLFRVYDTDEKTVFARYKRGVGTDPGLLPDITGAAFGAGADARVSGMLYDIQDVLTSYQRQNNVLPDKILLDVFGFSRGAATARHFINVIKQGAYLFAPPFDTIKPDTFRISFAGVFDTVGSFGNPGDDDDGDKTFAINPAWIDGRVVHFVADDEYRKNFDVQTLFASQAKVPQDLNQGSLYEWVVPGAHADVGGGYGSGKEHGCTGNHLSRIYLHRMLEDAIDSGVPLLPITDEYYEGNSHWDIDPNLQRHHKELMNHYNNNPALQKEHKLLREWERGVEYETYRLERLIKRPSNHRNRGRKRALIRARKERIDRYRTHMNTQQNVVEGCFSSPQDMSAFMDTYDELYNNYIHHSHAPKNTMIGMSPQVHKQGFLRREVFYKPVVNWAKDIGTKYEAEKFDD